MGGIRPFITSPYAHHTPSPGVVSPLDNPDQEAKRMGASHGAWLWTLGPRFLSSNTHPAPCTSQSQPQTLGAETVGFWLCSNQETLRNSSQRPPRCCLKNTSAQAHPQRC